MVIYAVMLKCYSKNERAKLILIGCISYHSIIRTSSAHDQMYKTINKTCRIAILIDMDADLMY